MLLDLISADTTLRLAQDVKGCYFSALTLSLGFEIESSHRVPTEHSTRVVVVTIGKWKVAFQTEGL